MRLSRPIRPFLGILVLASIVAAYPFLMGRYAFLLDFHVGPTWNPNLVRGFGFGEAAYGGYLPLFVLLIAIANIIGISLIQKMVLFGVTFLLALTAYATIPGDQRIRLYAAVLFLFTPFVYARLLVGHWVLLLGLAALPILLVTVKTYLDDGGLRNLLPATVALTVLGFSAHLLLASTILVGFLVLFKAAETRSGAPLRRAATVAVAALPVNAYWLGPVLLADGPELADVAASDVVTYAPNVDTLTALLSVATMHGFWRGGIVYAKDVFPPVLFLYAVILFLAVYGFVANYRHPERGYVVRAVGATAVVALLLGAGVRGPAEPVYHWAFESVPFFAGMRDSQKFVALLVVAYAYLGALGLGELRDEVRSLDLGLVHRSALTLGSFHLPGRTYDRSQALAAFVVVLAILTPVAYTFPMVTGYADQVNSQDYPPEWYEVREYLDDQPGDDAVLFLPWHQYMDYSWLESDRKRIATPARVFFDRPVIQGDNVEVGPTYSTSTNPVSRYVEFLFGLGPEYEEKPIDNMGELLTHIDVKYVLVTKEVDWREYDDVLQSQSDLTLVLENDEFRVYRNERTVDRAYAVDRITYVSGWEDFLDRSRIEDTTESVYVVDRERAGDTEAVERTPRRPVDAETVHPAKYVLAGSSNTHTVFVQHQATYAETWRYDGREPTARHLGMSPVFRTDGDGGVVTYETFYRVYVPSYLVSLVTLLVLIVFAVGDRRRDLAGVVARRAEQDGRNDRS